MSDTLTLGGWLWRPVGAGPFPAVVFNHGSEAEPGKKEGQALFYVPHGFVLFIPHRRGHGLSRTAGRYIGAFDDNAQAQVEALVQQTDDVLAAVEYLRSLAYVRKERVFVVGCSFGGIESLLAAENGAGIAAAVDFAGAAMTWSRNAPLRERMSTAVRKATSLILLKLGGGFHSITQLPASRQSVVS